MVSIAAESKIITGPASAAEEEIPSFNTASPLDQFNRSCKGMLAFGSRTSVRTISDYVIDEIAPLMEVLNPKEAGLGFQMISILKMINADRLAVNYVATEMSQHNRALYERIYADVKKVNERDADDVTQQRIYFPAIRNTQFDLV